MSSSEAASRLGNRVAVIVPTYQRADLVERALLSVQRQSHPADEVVVVDDGSTDGTAERIAKRFPKIAVVRQENRGVSAARNRGIRESTAPWVAFLDADDEWTEEKLERQLAAVMRSHRLVCHCDEIWAARQRW